MRHGHLPPDFDRWKLSVSSADRVVGETPVEANRPVQPIGFQYPRRIEWWVRLEALRNVFIEKGSFSILGGSSGG